MTPHDAEKIRRRDRVERGVSPGQRTPRSKNKGRAAKRPGKGERRAAERKAIASYA